MAGKDTLVGDDFYVQLEAHGTCWSLGSIKRIFDRIEKLKLLTEKGSRLSLIEYIMLLDELFEAYEWEKL